MDETDSLPFTTENWEALSDRRDYHRKCSVNSIRTPSLRLLHKLLSHSFLHRTTHRENVTAEDLWVLTRFREIHDVSFINAPWLLTRFMLTKGPGRISTSQICCGHFVTRIARNLDLLTPENIRAAFAPTGCDTFYEQDMVQAGIAFAHPFRLSREIGGAPDPHEPEDDHEPDQEEQQEQEQEEQQQPAPQAPPAGGYGFNMETAMSTLTDGMGRIEFRQVQGHRTLESMVDWDQYHYHRYQPVWEHTAREYYSSPAGSPLAGTHFQGPYSPPALHSPVSWDYFQQQQHDQQQHYQQDPEYPPGFHRGGGPGYFQDGDEE